MSNDDVPLSYSADELLGVLERQVRGDGPASAWLRALVSHDPSLAASVAPGGDVNAVVGTESAEAGPTVTRALVADRASRRASTLGAAVAKVTDVAAALVEMTGEATTGERPPVEPPPAAEQTAPPAVVEPPQPETPTRRPPQQQVRAEPLERPTPTRATARREEAPSAAGSAAGRARTFRVFVSSTFEDFGVERDVLRREVWPPLRDLCARNGARFQPIDLRWGVSEEAAIDQQAMNICLGEIKRCQDVTPRPDFLVLLGNRYGWLPPPPQIPEGEFTKIAEWLGKSRDSVPRLDKERVPPADDLPPKALLERWYERDENALGPVNAPGAERRLRRRTGAYLDRDVWEGVEKRLVKSLAAAAEGLGLPEESRRRYVFSATAQEIAAGALDAESPDQAVCFIREIAELPEGPGAKPYVDVDGDQRDENAAVALENLKQALTNHLGERRVVMAERSVSWGSHGPEFTEDYLRDFAVRVRDVLARSIEEELEHPTVGPEEGALETGDALDQEVAAHQRFAAERRTFFTGRSAELARIQGYLDGLAPQPLAVYGEGGTGKSAVIAQALLQAEKRDGATVVARFIGATPGSSDGRSLLTSMCQELARVTQDTETPVPTDYADLVRDFHHRLEEAAVAGPVWVFVDSLDQLAAAVGSARSLTWVPQTLPPGVRMVLSTRPGDTLEPLRARAEQLELGGLPAVDGAELLTKWLDGARRTLQDSQRQAVLNAFERSEGNPLYLRLAFEEAVRWVSGDGEPPEELVPGLRGLIEGNLLERLASEDNHGEAVVAKALGYLAASRHGLAEDELTDLLSRDPELYRRFLLDAYHLPGDLVDSASSYAGLPAGQEPDVWLTFIREAARILEEEPWHLYQVLETDRGQTVEELAKRADLHARRVQAILSRMSSHRLAAADDQGRWTATVAASAAPDPASAWAAAYRAANGGDRWRFPELDPARTSGPEEGAAARAWLERLEEWRDELDTFLEAVVPARVPATAPEGQQDRAVRLVARPRPGPDLPVVFWSRLSFDLAPYLTERRTDEGDLLGFYHRELQDVAADVYARNENGQTLHGRLADYFQAEADPLGDRSWATDGQRGDVRGLSELPYHLTRAGRLDDVYETLTDFRFLEQKAAHVGVTTRTEAGEETKLYTGVFQLQDDYDTALAAMSGGEGDRAGGARLIVTAVDLGNGLVVRCPHCNTEHPFERECSVCKVTHLLADWKGKDLSCPNKKCGWPLRVNVFVVGRSPSG